MFQLLLKGCTIEAAKQCMDAFDAMFQLLLKGCTIEALSDGTAEMLIREFQLLLKGCTIEAIFLIAHS